MKCGHRSLPQKNVPQAEHMPHVMPRARSSKSSGRVRQIKQRSAALHAARGCWCSGAAWVDGWAAFARVSGCRLWFFNGCAACGEAWMLAAASGVVTAASMLFPPLSNAEMQFCARTDVHSHSQDDIGPDSEFKMGKTLSPLGTYPSGALRRAGASGDRDIAVAGCRRAPRPPRRDLRRRPRRVAREPCP